MGHFTTYPTKTFFTIRITNVKQILMRMKAFLHEILLAGSFQCFDTLKIFQKHLPFLKPEINVHIQHIKHKLNCCFLKFLLGICDTKRNLTNKKENVIYRFVHEKSINNDFL